MSIFTKAFWLATLERAIKTFAQTLAGLLGGDAVNVPGVSGMSLVGMLQVAGIATVVSVLTSVATHTATKTGPGVGTAETLSPPAPAIPVE
jgi:hypothetical protein